MMLTPKQGKWVSLFCHKDPWIASGQSFGFALSPSALSLWRSHSCHLVTRAGTARASSVCGEEHQEVESSTLFSEVLNAAALSEGN